MVASVVELPSVVLPAEDGILGDLSFGIQYSPHYA
jgi:hypothetical protein